MNLDLTQTKEKLTIASENIQYQDGNLRNRVIDAWLYNLTQINADSLPAVQAKQFQEIAQRLMQGRLLNNLAEKDIRDIAKQIVLLADEVRQL